VSQRSTALAERPETEPTTELAPWRAALRDQGGALHAFLPREEDRNRFLRVVAQAVQRTPDLQECTPDSLAAAAVEAAMYGLEPSGAAGGAHLVAFNTKVKRNRTEVWEKRAQLIVDYRGQLQLARDSDKVEDAYAVIVRKADRFRFDAANGIVEHEPDLTAPQSPNPEDAANPMTHVYGILVFRSGYRRPVVMSKAEVDAVRAMSKAANGPAWTGSYLEMAKKTVMHRLLKTAPLKPGARAILDRDPDYSFESRVSVEPVSADQPRALADRLRSKRLALGTTDPGESDASAHAGGAEAAAASTQDVTAAGSPDCAHPAKKHQATDEGVVCGDCEQLIAERDPEPAAAQPRSRAKAAAKPRQRKAKGEEGHQRARAHAIADKRGLDPDALKRIAGDVLGKEGDWSRTELDEEAWEYVANVVDTAPERVEDDQAWMDAATQFAGEAAIAAGFAKKLETDADWAPVEQKAEELMGTPADKLDANEWVELAIRWSARAA
jgi:phage RecT family recombinase